MPSRPPFSLNRIMQPDLSLPEFIDLAAGCSADGVEIRNDLADPSLLGGESPEAIRRLCGETGVAVRTVNALQRFNDPDLFDEKYHELGNLIREAAAVDCRYVVLCPVNDPADHRDANRRQGDLVAALERYAPLFDEYGAIGLVEPLGFAICSVRTKKEAVDAIVQAAHPELYRIVHDTFHHYLSGETEYFPEETGLIHVSGVSRGKYPEEMNDDDRRMVDEDDVMDNRGQVSGLYEGGFDGIFSFEPFSPEVQTLPPEDVGLLVKRSLSYLFD